MTHARERILALQDVQHRLAPSLRRANRREEPVANRTRPGAHSLGLPDDLSTTGRDGDGDGRPSPPGLLYGHVRASSRPRAYQSEPDTPSFGFPAADALDIPVLGHGYLYVC